MNYRQPIPAFVQNAVILLVSGMVASVLCAKVYGATLPVEEPTAPVTAATAPAPAAVANNDAVAAAQLRAMLMGRPVLLGTATPTEPRR